MEKREVLYEGKAKKIYLTDKNNILLVEYTDQTTALNGKRKEQIANKGQLNSAICDLLFKYLNQNGVKNHYIKQISNNKQLVKKVNILPIEVVVRNFASGHFVTKYNVLKMTKLSPSIHEFYLKNDALDDPFMNDEQICTLNIATKEELELMRNKSNEVNVLLTKIFNKINIRLVDFKLEFGYNDQNELILADELSPDNMRLVDKSNGKSLDKDIFRKNLGDVNTGYQIVLKRLQDVLTIEKEDEK